MPAINEEKQTYDNLTKLKGGNEPKQNIQSDDDMDDELVALNKGGKQRNNDMKTEEKKEIEDGTLIITKDTETETDNEQNQDENDKKILHEIVDTVDDILENYNLNEMNISEISDEQEVDPNDQPGYNKLESESKSKAIAQNSVKRSSTPKPNLETINSE